MKKEKIKMTQEGLEELKKELVYRTKTKRKELSKALADARSEGDLSENDGYTLTLDQIDANESRIAELEELIKNAEIVQKSKSTSVQIGSTVTLKQGNNLIKYQMVNNIEGDPLNNKISVDSPIGKALLGKKKGETITLKNPSGETTYIIKDIS